MGHLLEGGLLVGVWIVSPLTLRLLIWGQNFKHLEGRDHVFTEAEWRCGRSKRARFRSWVLESSPSPDVCTFNKSLDLSKPLFSE